MGNGSFFYFLSSRCIMAAAMFVMPTSAYFALRTLASCSRRSSFCVATHTTHDTFPNKAALHTGARWSDADLYRFCHSSNCTDRTSLAACERD